MANIVKLLPTIDAGLNIKLVCVTSTELFNKQPKSYQQQIVTEFDKTNSTVITTQARGQMSSWLFDSGNSVYAISSDWDNRWRTGGTLEEVLDEAHLSPEWILKGIERFIASRRH
ncbi:MAG: hypothetical protein H0S79_15705 [Anaerolineaceae bacterium]|nr:hypothetical protein [Anaerolineaceae bacterium]